MTVRCKQNIKYRYYIRPFYQPHEPCYFAPYTIFTRRFGIDVFLTEFFTDERFSAYGRRIRRRRFSGFIARTKVLAVCCRIVNKKKKIKTGSIRRPIQEYSARKYIYIYTRYFRCLHRFKIERSSDGNKKFLKLQRVYVSTTKIRLVFFFFFF